MLGETSGNTSLFGETSEKYVFLLGGNVGKVCVFSGGSARIEPRLCVQMRLDGKKITPSFVKNG